MEWLSSSPSTKRTRGPYYEFLGAAPRRSLRCWLVVGLVAAMLVGLFAFSGSLHPHGFSAPSFDSPRFGPPSCPAGSDEPYLRPHMGNYIEAHEDIWTWKRVKAMVAMTNGFYARDWPLQLGWNNVRYIIEAALMHSALLNRTLVIPSFVYARSCVFDFDVCSSYAQRFHRGDDIGMGDFKYLSDEEQTAWRLPIELMLDMPRLRSQHSVITVAEYLRLYRIDPALELGNGAWDEHAYHGGPFAPTLSPLPQTEWDDGFARVDVQPSGVAPPSDDDPIAQALRARGTSMSISDAQGILREHGVLSRYDDRFTRELERHGFVRMYSFRGSYVEMFKAVTDWEDEVSDVTTMRGLVDQFNEDPADVVHVRGETHWNRKAGQLRFTSAAARTRFAELVLHGISPIPPIQALGDRLSRRMADINGGRQYLAAHMRRGDFAVLGWTEPTIEDHIKRIEQRMTLGHERLHQLSSERPKTVAVPGIVPDTFFASSPAPRSGDRFFLATDVRNETERALLREHGAVLMDDLLEPADTRVVGWPMLFGDLRAQVEQEVATHAAFFYGHSMSSVAGGVANLRAARGQDPRTCYVD